MKQSGLVSSFRSEEDAGVLVESTVVFPLLVLVVFGVIELSLLMFDWSAGTKATYRGARVAIVNDPVASGAHFSKSLYTTMATKSGVNCIDDNGSRNTSAACPIIDITCTGAAGTSGTCTSGSFNNTSFTKIFDAVQRMYPNRALDRAQLQVSYKTSDLGFVGRENFDGTYGQLPMNVTVSLRCMRHQFFFVAGLLDWVFPAQPGCSDVTSGPQEGLQMPNFYTTLPSESLHTF